MKTFLSAAIGLLVGVSGTLFILSESEKQTNGQHVMPDGQMMDNMVSELSSETGDAFDRAFLIEMIEHHEGAIDMAEAARTNAKHEEIRQMAEAIISAQAAEITQMEEWQKSWYPIQ